MKSEDNRSEALSNILASRIINVLSSSCTPSLGIQSTIAIAGGGSTSLSAITSMYNSSKILLEGNLLYSRRSFIDYTGEVPDSFSSIEAANMLSNRSLERSIEISTEKMHSIGIGCASNLRSDGEREKRVHRCFVRLTDVWGNVVGYNSILRASDSRGLQEEMTGCLILTTILEYLANENMELKDLLSFAKTELNKRFVDLIKVMESNTQCTIENQLKNIFSRKSDVVVLLPHCGEMKAMATTKLPNNSIILPGSFNPIHIGHVELASATSQVVEEKKNVKPLILFELSIMNVDKPALEMEQVLNRCSVVYKTMNSNLNWGLVLTSSPLFLQKANILSKVIIPSLDNNLFFAIGADTCIRIINLKYYSNNYENMLKDIRIMKSKGVHFVVGGRLEQNKQLERVFISGGDQLSTMPSDIQEMFTLLSQDDFRVDISSTEIRNNLT